MDRRNFLKIIGVGAGTTYFTACRRNNQSIVSSISMPERLAHSEPLYYSSVYTIRNIAYPIIIKTVEGRPIKVDGNPLHPISRGKSDKYVQASLYDLYNPERFRQPTINGRNASLQECMKAVLEKLKDIEKQGKYACFLLDEHCSPYLNHLIFQLLDKFNFIKFFSIKSVSNSALANKQLLQINSDFIYQLNKANLIISIDYDFLGDEPTSFYNQLNFSETLKNEHFKLITLESSYSVTGEKSNLRFDISPYEAENILYKLLTNINNRLKILDVNGCSIPNTSIDSHIEHLTNDLLENKGKCIVLTGCHLSIYCHSLAIIINYLLDSIGINKPLNLDSNLMEGIENYNDINSLNSIILNNQCGFLAFLGDNSFNEVKNYDYKIINMVDNSNILNLSLYSQNVECYGVELPMAHQFESWGDARCYNGWTSIRQPVIMPLNPDSISMEEFIFYLSTELTNNINNQGHGIYSDLKNFYSFSQDIWENTLKSGYYYQDNPVVILDMNCNYLFTNYLNKIKLENNIHDRNIYYLRISNTFNNKDISNHHNPVLNEIPDSFSGMINGITAIISKELAKRLDIRNGDLIEISKNQKKIVIFAYITEEDNSNVVYISDYNYNYIKELTGIDGIDFNDFYSEYLNSSIDGFMPIEIKKIEELKYLKESHNKLVNNILTKYSKANKSDFDCKGHRWGMLIDISRCIGCSSCVVACQIENNIPVVGYSELQKGRSMQWITINRIKDANALTNNMYIPIMCQHCEKAPCEMVCPVTASTHSPEGINETTYNRCVGSRICMTNCPYKVRKFNYLDYSNRYIEPLNLIFNPDVTVRMKGVVEKCSFCVQRIEKARNKALLDGLLHIPDGLVKTACQQACPMDAIIFGDLNDDDSEIRKYIDNNTTYALLGEKGTIPSIYYKI